jgi:hypothetical protein
MTSIPYKASDAWLLLSILLAASAEGATLDGIISVGDAINHAVFTFGELDGGLARLVKGGLVKIDGQRVLPTDEATRLHRQVEKRKRGMLSQMDAIREKLGAPPWSTPVDPNATDPAWSQATFSPVDLERAYTSYKHRLLATPKKPKGRRG